MACSHGKGDRLDVGGVDLIELEAAEANGDGPRVGLLNHFLGPGKFDRMFPDLGKFRPDDAGLVELATVMKDEPVPGDPDGQPVAGDSDVAGGITYLGQFVDHDITLDKTAAGFPLIDDAATVEQARSPSLDLDSLYGMGPVAQPELYDPAFPPDRARFVIGLTSPLDSPLTNTFAAGPQAPVSQPNDLPRRDDRSAILAEDRNDENLAIAQTHLSFLKFHNAVMAITPGPEEPPEVDACCYSRPDGGDTQFHRAMKIVRYHYQWIVLHEFLESLVDAAVLQDVLANGRKFYNVDDGPVFMPVEFSVAAYRLGHSMIRDRYDWNRTFNNDGPPAITDGSLDNLFRFTGGGGFIGEHVKLPSNWIVDWRRLFDFGRADLVMRARKLNTQISPRLHDLPANVAGPVDGGSLPARNLKRGSRIGLPTGQDVAAAMGVAALTPAELITGPQGPTVAQFGFDEETPLWYYILKEAEVTGGDRLGAVGSRILAEVFVGLLQGSPHSYLSEDPSWMPTLGATPGTFTMADMIRFGDPNINPLGPGAEGP